LVYNTSMYYTMRIRNDTSRRIAMYHLEEYRRIYLEIEYIYNRYCVENKSECKIDMLRRIIDEKFPLNDSDVPF